MVGGREGIRTPDPLLAKQVLSQLCYTPTVGVPFILKHLPTFQNPFLRICVNCPQTAPKTSRAVEMRCSTVFHTDSESPRTMISLFNPLFRSGLEHRIPEILLESKRLTSQVEARSLTRCSCIEDANRMSCRSRRKGSELGNFGHSCVNSIAVRNLDSLTLNCPPR